MNRRALKAAAGKMLLFTTAVLLSYETQAQPPFWRDMFAVARPPNSVVGLSHQRCKYMKNTYEAEAISWYSSGAVIHNHACWAPSKKFDGAIDFCVFANLKQPPLCFPKAKTGFVDARDFRLPRGAFR